MRTRRVFQDGTDADAVAHFVHAGWVHVRPADGDAWARRLQASGPVTTIDAVLDLYDRWGAERYDEEVGQLDHALQTAALAASGGAADPLVAAALLHDVGHLLALRGGPAGPHERTAPTFLAALFPESVTGPIALHVAAKRYLCAVEPHYHAGLSAGSQRSLRRQGGAMVTGEVEAFEATPGWADAVALRRWDDAGKVDDAVVPGIASYEPLLRSLACSGS
jgi:predicted HD phosphohydrolase